MYIKYSALAEIIALLFPVKFRKKIRNIGEDLKINQNLAYINKNKKKVIKNLKHKIKNGEKLIVAFFVYDETKWKCQSLYDLLEQSEYFIPHIFVTKNDSPRNNFNFQLPETIHKIYDFFKAKNMRVHYAYDFDKDEYIAFENMKPVPDVIIYCHPWYINKVQGPVMTSKFAINGYVPYFIPASVSPIEYYLRFHRYIQSHYVLNDEIKNAYGKDLDYKLENMKAVGHPILDYFYLNKNREYYKHDYVIFAPHWSCDSDNNLRWGTFLWSAEFILNYAKKHPEINWLFKPHPCLKGYLRNKNLWSEAKIENYWAEWGNLGKVYESGDYLDLFMESKAMITDCGTFKIEYFMTQKPQIYLKTHDCMGFNDSVNRINSTSYVAYDQNELETILDEVLINEKDYFQNKRKEVYEMYGYANNYAAENIINDIKKTLGIVEDV